MNKKYLALISALALVVVVGFTLRSAYCAGQFESYDKTMPDCRSK